MKVLKKIGIFLLILFSLFTVLVLICAFRPDVTEAIAGFLYPNQQQDRSETAEGGGLSARKEGDGAGASAAEASLTTRESGEGSKELLSPELREEREAPEAEGLDENISSEYVLPEESEITVPEQVVGKNGYQQIQDEGEQIEDDAAKALEEQIGVGDIGDGLVFDALFYPYYGMLDEKGKHLYRQIYANANALYQTFAPVEQVSAVQLRNVFAAVYNDHPELFWLETAYYCKYKRNGQCVQIDLQFHTVAQDLDGAKAVFAENASTILNQAYGLESDYAKEKLVHDLLIERTSYRMGAGMSQSAYSALVNGETVCAGYARAFQYLMQQLQIPCYCCTGYAGEKHAWNIVLLEDGFYNVDVTWDDTEGGNYEYFNCSDQDYAGTHVRQELSVYLPPCNGQQYRKLEQSQTSGWEGEGSLRSLADVGVTEEELLYNLSDYYVNCYDQIIAGGQGTYEFSNVIEGEALAREIQEAYQRNDYREGYMEQAMTALQASACEMDLRIEELQQNRYMITHSVKMR